MHLEVIIFYGFGKFQVREFQSWKNVCVLEVACMALAHSHIKTDLPQIDFGHT